MLHEFTFQTFSQYQKAVRIVRMDLGLDYEADPDTRTLFVEIEDDSEYDAIMQAYNA